jgi:hypothetical protein
MLNVKQGDSARKIYISLTDGGRPYKIAEDCTARLRAKTSADAILFNDCTIKDNIIEYTLTNETCKNVGIVECEVELRGVDSNKITSPRFSLIVEGVVVGDKEIEATNEFTALTNALAKVDDAESKKNKVETITDDATNEQYPSAKAVADYVKKNGGGSSGGGVGKANEELGEVFNYYGEREEIEGVTVGNIASGRCSHAEGMGTTASANCAHAEGSETEAANDYAHTEGRLTVASGNAAHSEGLRSVASGTQAHAEGRDTIASGTYGSHAEGYNTKAIGNYAHSEGSFTNALGSASHTEGYASVNPPEDVSADTDYVSVYAAWHSLKEASKFTLANGVGAHSEGRRTLSLGNGAHAEGDATAAKGTGAHSEGRNTKAINAYAHGEGLGAIAEGECSHAEGKSTHAKGTASHAEGEGTAAEAKWSHAGGVGTRATAQAQTAIGRYNKENTSALFIVGNGASDENRSNAYEVLRDGSANLQTQGEGDNSVVIMATLKAEIAKLQALLEEKTITFTIDGETHTAEKGMNFESWWLSEYNHTEIMLTENNFFELWKYDEEMDEELPYYLFYSVGGLGHNVGPWTLIRENENYEFSK